MVHNQNMPMIIFKKMIILNLHNLKRFGLIRTLKKGCIENRLLNCFKIFFTFELCSLSFINFLCYTIFSTQIKRGLVVSSGTIGGVIKGELNLSLHLQARDVRMYIRTTS